MCSGREDGETHWDALVDSEAIASIGATGDADDTDDG